MITSCCILHTWAHAASKHTKYPCLVTFNVNIDAESCRCSCPDSMHMYLEQSSCPGDVGVLQHTAQRRGLRSGSGQRLLMQACSHRA